MRALPFPCPLQPLPASKQEARLGHLPDPGLGQKAEETSVEDYPQNRRGLLRNPWAGEVNPDPIKNFLRAGAACTPQHGLWVRHGLSRIHRDASARREPSQEPPLREAQVTQEAEWGPRGLKAG